MKRRPAIGNDPLDVLMPAPPADRLAHAPEAPRRLSSMAKKKMTIEPPVELVDRVKAAAVALAAPPHSLTIAALVERALLAEVERLEGEYNQGQPFPKLTRKLRGGRPVEP